jgi:DNA-directed RNA polymerase specialized sigma24 family protein
MNKDWILTQESFDALLNWLDPRREEAGAKYENIRLRLIKIFTCRGCLEPEDLADETINRVSKKLPDIQDSYEGDPTRYFYGVANKVHLEYVRRKPPPPIPPVPDNTDEIEKEYECLEKCIEKLRPEHRGLVLDYYQEEKRTRIDHRKKLADQLGIALNALRIRAHRVRLSLYECVQNCVQDVAR